MKPNHRIYSMPVSSVYPLYIAKAEKKGRTKGEVDKIICWLTGYSQPELDRLIDENTSFKDFFDVAQINPSSNQITGIICGVRIEEIEDPLMRKVRYLDKLIDELAKGKPMDAILRTR